MPAPKIIHQTWMQGWDKTPDHLLANVDAVGTMNPEYRHMKWDEESIRGLCASLGPEYLQRYDSFQYLMSKVEFGRYVILYSHGGISIDTDMKPLKPLRDCKELGEHDILISRAAFPYGMIGLVNNALIITEPKHPFLKQVLDTIVAENARESSYLTKEMFIHFTTGPEFINRMCRQYKGTIYYLDNKYFEPCISVDPLCKISPDTIMDHQHELSWMGPTAKFITALVFYILYFGLPILLAAGVGLFAVFMWRSRRTIMGLNKRSTK